MFEIFDGEPTFVCDWCRKPIFKFGWGTWNPDKGDGATIYVLHNQRNDPKWDEQRDAESCLFLFQAAHPENCYDHHLEHLLERTAYTDRRMAQDWNFWNKKSDLMRIASGKSKAQAAR